MATFACVIHSPNNDVQLGTFTNAFMINVLLARLDQVRVVMIVSSIHCVAVQEMFTVSAVIVQSGAVTLFAVTVVAHDFHHTLISFGFITNC